MRKRTAINKRSRAPESPRKALRRPALRERLGQRAPSARKKKRRGASAPEEAVASTDPAPSPETFPVPEAPEPPRKKKNRAKAQSPSLRAGAAGDIALEFAGEVSPKPSPGGAPANAADARAILANLLFASPEPLSLQRLSALTGGLTGECLELLLDRLADDMEAVGLGVDEVAGGFQMRTSPDRAEWVWKLSRRKQARPPLSPAALETVAIVAYKQPATKRDVDAIRGVESGAILRHLVEEEFIEAVGRQDSPGRPLLYSTTPRFLKTFGLATVADLPSMDELRKLFGERERERSDKEAESFSKRRQTEREAALERIAADARLAAAEAAARDNFQTDLFDEDKNPAEDEQPDTPATQESAPEEASEEVSET